MEMWDVLVCLFGTKRCPPPLTDNTHSCEIVILVVVFILSVGMEIFKPPLTIPSHEEGHVGSLDGFVGVY